MKAEQIIKTINNMLEQTKGLLDYHEKQYHTAGDDIIEKLKAVEGKNYYLSRIIALKAVIKATNEQLTLQSYLPISPRTKPMTSEEIVETVDEMFTDTKEILKRYEEQYHAAENNEPKKVKICGPIKHTVYVLRTLKDVLKAITD